jgi:anti-sigma28 factor (negative regulator of flagellin synthesis)
MRLQLDSTTVGSEATKSGAILQSPAAEGADSASSRVSSTVYGGQDSIQISGASSAVNRAETDRAAHIQQLTAAIQGGSYNVSSARVSSAIVDYATS